MQVYLFYNTCINLYPSYTPLPKFPFQSPALLARLVTNAAFRFVQPTNQAAHDAELKAAMALLRADTRDLTAARSRLEGLLVASTAGFLDSNHISTETATKKAKTDHMSCQSTTSSSDADQCIPAGGGIHELAAVATTSRIFPLPHIPNAAALPPHTVATKINHVCSDQLNLILTSLTHTWQTGKSEPTKFDFSAPTASLQDISRALARASPPVTGDRLTQLRSLAAIVSRRVGDLDRTFTDAKPASTEVITKALKGRFLSIVLGESEEAFDTDVHTFITKELTLDHGRLSDDVKDLKAALAVKDSEIEALRRRLNALSASKPTSTAGAHPQGATATATTTAPPVHNRPMRCVNCQGPHISKDCPAPWVTPCDICMRKAGITDRAVAKANPEMLHKRNNCTNK